MPLGTSMDYESSDSRSKGCWDPASVVSPFLEKWTSLTETPDFIIDDVWCGMVGSIGFGGRITAATTDFWMKTLKDVYKGDDGRKKVRMAALCLVTRDGLLSRIGDIRCPVYWLQVNLVIRSSQPSFYFICIPPASLLSPQTLSSQNPSPIGLQSPKTIY
jgi:hypothetical protein